MRNLLPDRCDLPRGNVRLPIRGNVVWRLLRRPADRFGPLRGMRNGLPAGRDLPRGNVHLPIRGNRVWRLLRRRTNRFGQLRRLWRPVSGFRAHVRCRDVYVHYGDFLRRRLRR